MVLVIMFPVIEFWWLSLYTVLLPLNRTHPSANPAFPRHQHTLNEDSFTSPFR